MKDHDNEKAAGRVDSNGQLEMEWLAEDTPVTTNAAKEKPTPEEWRGLYEAAINLRRIEPWKCLYDTDIITITLPNMEGQVYCAVLGANGECYGIMVYPDYEALTGHFRIMEYGRHAPVDMMLDLTYLACYFGDREELEKEDRDLLKSLDIRFRGRGEWIYFRSMNPGLVPWFLTSAQIGLLKFALENLAVAVIHLATGEVEVDFDEGETLLRQFSPEDDMWLTGPANLPPPVLEPPELVLTDEKLIGRLKKCKRSAAKLEFGMTYLPAPVRDKKGERPYFPRILLLIDTAGGLIIGQKMLRFNECFEDALFEMIIGHIIDHGRPVSIRVRDKYTGCYFEDLCNRMDVKLISGKGVPAVDEAFAELSRFVR